MLKTVCLTGAFCLDGSSILSKVNGSVWLQSKGVFTLVACPAGYYLNSQQCALCPASFYCTGGVVPATLCDYDMFALPGAESKDACAAAVYVVVSIDVSVPRPAFTDTEIILFQQALADTLHLNVDYVIVDTVQAGENRGSTSVTARIAASNAWSAAATANGLNSSSVSSVFTSLGLSSSSITMIQVTGCIPGFELSASWPCQQCPSNYFCTGGSAQGQPCPANSFSSPGSNSSGQCVPSLFVVVTFSLSINENAFNSSVQLKFISALAATVGVAIERIIIAAVEESRRSLSSIQVTTEIAAADSQKAEKISNSLDQSTLNSKLAEYGITVPCSIESVSVTGMEPGQVVGFSESFILGCTLGVFSMVSVIVLLCASLRNKESEEEIKLRLDVQRLLARLQATPREGYFLSNRGAPFWLQVQTVVFLQKSHVEAAARLGNLQDFDIGQFDSFCLSLENRDFDSDSKQYMLLSDWILELSTSLIRPDLEDGLNASCHLQVEDRFPYFLKRVSKARIWSENPDLFKKLQVLGEHLAIITYSSCQLFEFIVTRISITGCCFQIYGRNSSLL